MDIEEIKDLVKRSQEKDKDAFSRLFDFYYDKIINYVFRRTLDVEYSKDITSNVFLKALDNINSFKWKNGIDSFNAWIFKIATNEINQYFRKQNRYKLIIDDPEIRFNLKSEDNLAFEIEKKVDNDKYLIILSKAIKELKPIYQDILHLRYFEEMPYNEISEILNKNESTVRVYAKRAIEELERVLKKDAINFINYGRTI
ncbi:MAG TPA: sigma-70 family RNA polymerase sigma factor [Candidatus Pacearchaeota archaeon]|jgi:RNA polymerase sigma-70 factor (ECF subfamily)|nr:sigma-70 family RNA polymerase sigma factor [Parcubacteria group bacterium]HOF44740.1 sigma-70 family RNA polymerase sigma factor [Candidatus Pacearchaeota archaeon]HOS12652.1 sigma-70 family RNA polymerase sigma factor [Candidatus Pacearchaeota archaeon]HPL72560.1 sigma-70 family RNA polymerase sigma factor [Candidatus Pacearchaeota archaeon]HRT18075.1 sigma-70 family RNA polymerase sigma factor [Candidatus Paceibacterota bacterium]